MNHFKEMQRLFEEASADLCNYQSLMIEIWKDTKDKRIEALFREGGGIMIDGKYLFHDEPSDLTRP